MDNKERIVLDVAYQPQVRTNMDTKRIMLNVMLALVPSLLAAAYEFGFKPVLMVAVSMSSAVFYEWAYRRLTRKSPTIF
ncbi:MAG: RnfABCDGE type electron transport complex subunit D, partial [Oscillospiraceae bacterium]|nr:RnfABCDGE type electron transport complex subunit D [Oscillospiraceae bacterium]